MNTNKPTNYSALSTLVTVFFFWGFIAAGNSVFIPFCKHYFHLDQFQSQLIDFAFYLAYFVGAYLLFVAGATRQKDLVGSWGYKRSIVYGLLFSALGAAVMIVSVYLKQFAGMLAGLFIVALGFSLQQTSANPFMIALGDEKSGSNRINLGGGINSLGTSIGPLIVALSLFGKSTAISDADIASLGLGKVMILYACVGLLFLFTAALFGYSKKVPAGVFLEKPEPAGKAIRLLLLLSILLAISFIPVFASYKSENARKIEARELVNGAIRTALKNEFSLSEEKLEELLHKSGKLDERLEQGLSELLKNNSEIRQLSMQLDKQRMVFLSGGLLAVVLCLVYAFKAGRSHAQGWGAMQFPQVNLGMLAIFIYVGVEVAIGSNLGELLRQKAFGGYTSSEIAPFVAMYWGSLMVGRWAGGVSALNISDSLKKSLRLVMPMLAWACVMGFTALAGYNTGPLKWYFICVLIQIAAFYLTDDKPALTLLVFGALGAVAALTGLLTTGIVAVYAFLSAGLFLSIMWPCIFSLSLAGTAQYQSQGSGLLIMMILGGAIIPPIQGKLADITGIHSSFILVFAGLLYISWFAWYVRSLLKQQGISFDEPSDSGH